MISAFTYIHNALEGGYPIVEAIRSVEKFVDEVVVADLESTDGTKEMLNGMFDVRVIEGHWGNEAGVTLAAAHYLHNQCEGDMILHFEGDEVWDPFLASDVCHAIENDGLRDARVWRLQLEQNFQRCRWYPELVHRVFPKGSVVKVGHTTDRDEGMIMPAEKGFLWDVTNCFRDNWTARVANQSALWDQPPSLKMVPLHFMTVPVLSLEAAQQELTDERWTWKRSPFDLPPLLKRLVGMVRYEPPNDLAWR